MAKKAKKAKRSKKPKQSLLRRYFFTGILVTAPIGLTLYLSWGFIVWMDEMVNPYIPDIINPNVIVPFEVPGVGLIAALITLTAIGAVMTGFLGDWFTNGSEAILNRLPVVKSIYTVIKQILHAALTDQSQVFRETVLVEFPRKECWVMGFVTGRDRDAIDVVAGQKMVSVLVPTTPSLSSGYMIFVPEEDAKPVAIPPDRAIKMIVSGGLIT